MKNFKFENQNVPHIQSLLLATIVVAAFLGPISVMAAKMAGY